MVRIKSYLARHWSNCYFNESGQRECYVLGAIGQHALHQEFTFFMFVNRASRRGIAGGVKWHDENSFKRNSGSTDYIF